MDQHDDDGALRFPQHRLEVYRVAVELAAATKRFVDTIPKGHRGLADQAQRAATSTVLLIAEGANRRSGPDKRQRYSLARGECGELAAAVELARAYEIGRLEDIGHILARAGRVNAMLLRLEQSFSSVGRGPGRAPGTRARADGQRAEEGPEERGNGPDETG